MGTHTAGVVKPTVSSEGSTSGDSYLPLPVSGGLTFSSINGGGFDNYCAVTTDDDLYCWGEGNGYSMGDGDTSDNTTPGFVVADAHSEFAKWDSAGDFYGTYSCSIKNNGSAFCWGETVTGAGEHMGVGYNYGNNHPRYPTMVLSGKMA